MWELFSFECKFRKRIQVNIYLLKTTAASTNTLQITQYPIQNIIYALPTQTKIPLSKKKELLLFIRERERVDRNRDREERIDEVGDSQMLG